MLRPYGLTLGDVSIVQVLTAKEERGPKTSGSPKGFVLRIMENEARAPVFRCWPVNTIIQSISDRVCYYIYYIVVDFQTFQRIDAGQNMEIQVHFLLDTASRAAEMHLTDHFLMTQISLLRKAKYIAANAFKKHMNQEYGTTVPFITGISAYNYKICSLMNRAAQRIIQLKNLGCRTV